MVYCRNEQMKVGDIDIEEVVFEKTKELLLRYGVKGWNMNDLARESNMSKRTLYKIIGNKEDLLAQISRKGLLNTISRMENYLQSNQPFPTLLNNLSAQIVGNFDDYTLTNLKAIRLEYPRIQEMEELHLKKQREFFVRFFQKGKDEGCIADHAKPASIEKIIHALIEYHIYTCNNKTEFRTEMKEVLSTFLKGVTK